MINNVFAPHGNTKRLAVRSSAYTTVRMTVTSNFLKADSYLITNLGPSIIALGYGSSAAEAMSNASFPSAGDTTGVFCFIVPPGQRTIDALSKNIVYFAAVTASGTADVLITPGRGEIAASLDDQSEVLNIAAILLNAVVSQRDLLEAIFIELKTHTYFLKEGLTVDDDPDLVRSDYQTDTII